MRDPLLMGLPDTVARAWIRRLVAKTSPEGYSAFRKEVEGQRFRNPETDNDVLFQSLPRREQARIYAQWRRKQRGTEAPKEKERGLVPVDREEARSRASTMADDISRWLVREPDEKIGERFFPGGGPKGNIQYGKMFFESVKGRPRPVKLSLGVGKHNPHLWRGGRDLVTGGMVTFSHQGRRDKDPYPTELRINLNPNRTYDNLKAHKDRLEREIYSVMIHEMTHARDIVESLSERERRLKKYKKKLKDQGMSEERIDEHAKDFEYHTRPSEARAFKRQVADEVFRAMERMHKDEDEPDWIGADADSVMDLLRKSPTWDRVRGFLTPELKRDFLKTVASVVRKFKEDRGGKVARRVAASWLRNAVSQERVDDLMKKVDTADLPFDHIFSGKRRMIVDPSKYVRGGLVQKAPAGSSKLRKFLENEGVLGKKDEIRWADNLIVSETDDGKEKVKGKLSKILNKQIQKGIKDKKELAKAHRRARKIVEDEGSAANKTFHGRFSKGMSRSLGKLAPVVMEDFPSERFDREMQRYGVPSREVGKKVEEALAKIAEAHDDPETKKRLGEAARKAADSLESKDFPSLGAWRGAQDEIVRRGENPRLHSIDLKAVKKFYESDEADEILKVHELGEDVSDEDFKKIRRYMEAEDLREQYADWKSVHGEDLVVLLSRDPVDVLRMSDHPDAPKKIESCHSEGGSYFECAVDEAEEGGLVAYAVRKSDVEGKDLDEGELFEDKQRNVSGIRPYSRLRFRRFENDEGFEVALPEERVYGAELDAFGDAMLEWARKEQPEFFRSEKGYSEYPKDWKMTGGSYQDTDSSDLFINFFDHTDKYEYKDSIGGRTRTLREFDEDDPYDPEFEDGDPYEEEAEQGPRQVRPSRKFDDQGQFWEWMREKHPKVPNPNPRGRQKEVSPDTLKGYARGNTGHSSRARQMVERYYAQFYDQGGVSGEEFAKVKSRTAAAWLRRVVNRL